MTEILRQKLLKLVRGEEGVALVVTLALFMFLYISCAGVYTVGKAVKDRIILQNAVDAAAYSAAVVQADYLSRIATINKAMAWNYAQFVKSQKNWIALYFLKKINEKASSYYRNSNLPSEMPMDPITVRVGGRDVDVLKNNMGQGWGDRDSAGYEADLEYYKNQAETYWLRIRDQNERVDELKSDMKDAIKSRAFTILMANLPFRIGELCRVLIKTPDELDVLGSERENDFVYMSGDDERVDITESRWFLPANYGEGQGFGRELEGELKTSSWFVKLLPMSPWSSEPTGGVDANSFVNELSSENMLKYYGRDYAAKPLTLPEKYFPSRNGYDSSGNYASAGAITVAIAKWNENPWKDLVADLKGIHAAFTHAEKNDWTFAIASAQAGYRRNNTAESPREYSLDETDFNAVKLGWDYDEELIHGGPDWDALYIPVRKAFANVYEFKNWLTNTAGDEWQELTSAAKSDRRYVIGSLGDIRFDDLNNRALSRMHNNVGTDRILKWDSDGIHDFLDLMYH